MVGRIVRWKFYVEKSFSEDQVYVCDIDAYL